MASIPLPALSIRAPQADPVADYTKAVQLKQLLAMQPGQQQLQQQQVATGQQEIDARAQQEKDMQTVQQTLAQHNGDIDSALPTLAGRVSPQTFMGISKFNMESKKNALDIDEKTRQAKLAQHDQLLGLIDQAQKLDPQSYAQSYPQIAQQALAIMPELKGHIDPANPVPQQALDQFRLGIQTETTFLKKAEAARAQQTSDFAAQKQPLEMAKLQDEVSQIGKKPGEDVPYSPEVFAQKKQLKASTNIMTGGDAKDIADAIENGDQPPTLQGLYRNAGPVRAELARRGVPLARMETDWKATQKYMGTLNGSQQVRLRQAVETASESLDKIDDLYKQLQAAAPTGGFKTWNKAVLAGAKQLPGKAGSLATNLEAQIADVTSELGNVYMGGNSPTDHALGLAGKQLSGDWNAQTFSDAIQQARANLKIRQNSITHGAPAGVSGDNNYFTQPTQQQAAPQTGGAFDFNKFSQHK